MNRFFGIMLLTSLNSFSQSNTFLISLNDTNSTGLCIESANDNGFVVGGFNKSYGIIIKTDSSGNFVWSTYFSSGQHVIFYDITTTRDLKYVLTGESGKNNSEVDLFYVKVNSSGDTMATRSFNINGKITGYSANATSDSGVVISGYYQDTITSLTYLFITKFDKLDNLTWFKTISLPNYGYGSIKQTNDGGYVVGSNYTDGVLLIKLDSAGNFLWNHLYNPSPTTTFVLDDIIENHQGFLIYASMLCAAGMIQTDTQGNIIWNNLYSGLCRNLQCKMTKTFDNCYVASSDEFDAGHIFKIDSSGNLLWAMHLPTSVYDVVQSSDSGYTAVGRNPSPIFNNRLLQIIKTHADGSGNQCSYTDTNVFSLPYNLIEDSINLPIDSSWIQTYSTITITHPLLNFDTTCFVLSNNTFIDNQTLLKVFPNPTHGNISIKLNGTGENFHLELFDSRGIMIYKKECSGNEIELDLQNFNSGLYFLRLVNSSYNLTKLIFLE